MKITYEAVPIQATCKRVLGHNSGASSVRESLVPSHDSPTAIFKVDEDQPPHFMLVRCCNDEQRRLAQLCRRRFLYPDDLNEFIIQDDPAGDQARSENLAAKFMALLTACQKAVPVEEQDGGRTKLSKRDRRPPTHARSCPRHGVDENIERARRNGNVMSVNQEYHSGMQTQTISTLPLPDRRSSLYYTGVHVQQRSLSEGELRDAGAHQLRQDLAAERSELASRLSSQISGLIRVRS